MQNSIDNPDNAMVIGISPRIVVNVLIIKIQKDNEDTHKTSMESIQINRETSICFFSSSVNFP